MTAAAVRSTAVPVAPRRPASRSVVATTPMTVSMATSTVATAARQQPANRSGSAAERPMMAVVERSSAAPALKGRNVSTEPASLRWSRRLLSASPRAKRVIPTSNAAAPSAAVVAAQALAQRNANSSDRLIAKTRVTIGPGLSLTSSADASCPGLLSGAADGSCELIKLHTLNLDFGVRRGRKESDNEHENEDSPSYSIWLVFRSFARRAAYVDDSAGQRFTGGGDCNGKLRTGIIRRADRRSIGVGYSNPWRQ